MEMTCMFRPKPRLVITYIAFLYLTFQVVIHVIIIEEVETNEFDMADNQEEDEFLSYPLDIDIHDDVSQLTSGQKPDFEVLNVVDYKYISQCCEHLCEENFQVLFLVKSAPENFKKRNVIRKTWGEPNITHRIIFFIGTNENHNIEVIKESSFYNDIVHVDFQDTYRNLTLKTMTIFKWVTEFCESITNIAIVDDDTVISVQNVLKFYRNPYTYPQESTEQLTPKTLYSGSIFHTTYQLTPLRAPSPKKHVVSYEEYPLSMYPPYSGGFCTFFTRDVIVDMYYAGLYTKYFWVDDVYVGILAKRLNVTPFSVSDYALNGYLVFGKSNDLLCTTSLYDFRVLHDIKKTLSLFNAGKVKLLI